MNTITWILLILLFTFLGSVGTYLFLRPKLSAVQELDEGVIQQNASLERERTNLITEITNYQHELARIQIDIASASEQLQISEKQAAEAADLFYKTHMALAEERMDRSLEEVGHKYQAAIAQFEAELQSTQEEGAAQLQEVIALKLQELNELDKTLALRKSEAAAAVEAAKRADEMKNQVNFYRIQLSDTDKEEIKMLRSIASQLRNQEPLNKVIWKVYYEKPVADLIGRVIGAGVHTGIYKITNIDNQKCYVGQAVNIAERWKQHIKRGVGAEAPTHNKLYPAMFEAGPENFTFEMIQECSRAELNAQEDYWQDYFKAKEFGYSIK